jgi:hypothetical protein
MSCRTLNASAAAANNLAEEVDTKLKVKEEVVEEPVSVDESAVLKAYETLMAEDPRWVSC